MLRARKHTPDDHTHLRPPEKTTVHPKIVTKRKRGVVTPTQGDRFQQT